MLRLAAAFLTASFAFPACAESGFAEVASLPLRNAASVLVLRGVCQLPAQPVVEADPTVPASRARTLSPRMLEAIRVEAEMPAD